MQDLFTFMVTLAQAWLEDNWPAALLWLVFIAAVAVFLSYEMRRKPEDSCADDDLGFQSLWEARIRQLILYPDREHAKTLYLIYLKHIDEIEAQTEHLNENKVESEENHDSSI